MQMKTRTDYVPEDQVESFCNHMEEHGWSVRQLVPSFVEGTTHEFFIVFEREAE